MDESARLKELQRGRSSQGLLGVGAARPAVTPPAERRAEPLASAQEITDRLDERGEVIADAIEDGLLAGDEVVDDLLHPRAQVFGVKRREHVASLGLGPPHRLRDDLGADADQRQPAARVS